MVTGVTPDRVTTDGHDSKVHLGYAGGLASFLIADAANLNPCLTPAR
jgi:hypothetical protein